MATRDWTTIFIQSRSEQEGIANDSLLEDGSSFLLSNPGNDEEYNMDTYEKPGWQRLMEIVEAKMEDIKKRMADLVTLHNIHTQTKNRIGKSEQQNEEEARVIEAHTAAISQLFKQCKADISCLEQKNKTREVDIIFNNLKMKLVLELNALMKEFRKSQQGYLQSLNKLKRSKQNASSLISIGDDDDDEEDEALTALAMDRGFTDAQKALLAQNQRDVLRRDKELREILKSIQDLHEMFEDMNALIVEQGSMLDRIDYNITQAQRYMKKSTKNIKSSERAQKASGWILCFLLIVVIGILAAIGIMIKIGVKYLVK